MRSPTSAAAAVAATTAAAATDVVAASAAAWPASDRRRGLDLGHLADPAATHDLSRLLHPRLELLGGDRVVLLRAAVVELHKAPRPLHPPVLIRAQKMDAHEAGPRRCVVQALRLLEVDDLRRPPRVGPHLGPHHAIRERLLQRQHALITRPGHVDSKRIDFDGDRDLRFVVSKERVSMVRTTFCFGTLRPLHAREATTSP